MQKGTPQSFDRAAASQYLKQQSERSTQAMTKVLISSETTSPTEHQHHEIAALSHPVVISVSVGSGPGKGQAWGCDLSYDYVKINAEYTT